MRQHHVPSVFAIALLCADCAIINASPTHAAATSPVLSVAARLVDDPQGGVGIALRQFENSDYLIVNDLIPGGSAAEDGHIQVGDEVVGLENEDGTILDFKGKTIQEVVALIRGPVDSKIKLVVHHKDEDGRKTYELKRKPLPM
jgi:C-terminal processing protease CtpA/Prc